MSTLTNPAALEEAVTGAVTRSGHLDGYTWQVKASHRRKHVALTTEAGGLITIGLPLDADPDKVVAFIGENLRQLAQHVRRQQDNPPPEHRVLRLADHEGFPHLGRAHSLLLADTARVTAEPRAGWGVRLHFPAHAAAMGDPAPLIRWICAEGTGWARTRAQPWLGPLLLRPNPPEIRVRHLGTRRWGVYRPKSHRVDLHWPLMQMPLDLIDYVLVHELVHASRPGGQPHGKAWQRRMDMALPSWRRLRKALNERGRRVWIGDVHTPGS